MKILLILCLCLSLEAKDYKIPQEWVGKRSDTTKGNIKKTGPITWGLYQVWPDDPMQIKNYVLLYWEGKHWLAKEHSQGGQPEARVKKGVLILEARSKWDGHNAQKLPAIIMTISAPGNYHIKGKIDYKFFEGYKKATMLILHVRKKEVTLITSYSFGKNTSHEIIMEKMKCKSKDQFILVPTFGDGKQEACAFHIKGLKISK